MLSFLLLGPEVLMAGLASFADLLERGDEVGRAAMGGLGPAVPSITAPRAPRGEQVAGRCPN